METENKNTKDPVVASQDGQVQYDDTNIVTLTGLEHIRLRPGMYIGKLDDGSKPDDGIYVLLEIVPKGFTIKTTVEITYRDITQHPSFVQQFCRNLENGIYRSALPVLHTSQFSNRAFVSSDIFADVTYGGLYGPLRYRLRR